MILGIRRLLTLETLVDDIVRAPRPRRKLFVDGVVVNVLNSKTALFFIAFLPQFVDPDPVRRHCRSRFSAFSSP